MADLTNKEIAQAIDEKANSYESLAAEYLQELLSFADNKIYNNMGRASATLQDPRSITVATRTLPSDSPKVNIPAFVFNPEDYVSGDTLQRYGYDSAFFDYLEPELKYFIDSETAFIDQTVQDALFAQTHERDIQALNDALDAVDRKQAQRGFPCPTSMFLAARNEVVKKFADTRIDRNSEITALIAERAADQVKHVITSGIQMEDIRSRFKLEYGKLYFQAADFLIRKFQSEVSAEVSRVNSELEMIKIKAQVDTSMLESDVARNNQRLESTKMTVDQIIEDARLDLETKKISATMQMEALTKVIEFYKGIHAAYTGQINGINLVTSSQDE